MKRWFGVLAVLSAIVVAVAVGKAQDVSQQQGSPILPAPVDQPGIEGLDGDWDGTLDLGSIRLRLVFHIRTTASGTTATLDSVDQGATGIPVASVSRSGDRLTLAVPVIQGTFEGQLAPDNQTIRGDWTQAGRKIPLTLARRAAGAPGPEARRPQTPKKPYPYRDLEVVFDNADANVSLAGTLTLPNGAAPYPTVILIAGSGPYTRNADTFGHQTLAVLGDHLTRNGFAVLRFDKRGIGKSSGDYAKSTTADFAADVEAAVAYLRTRSDIDQRRIGLVGHSEGGLIAPMVSARVPLVSFVVLLAGPGLRGEEILLAQTRLIAKATGLPDTQVDGLVELNRKVYAAVQNAGGAEEAVAAAREVLLATKPDKVPDAGLEEQARAAGSEWFRFFLRYDPAPALRQLNVPVLALNGEKDLQVPPHENLAAIRAAAGDRIDLETHELPGLNHLFQTAGSGAPAEYPLIEETIAPSVLDLVTAWMKKHTK